MSTKLEDDGQKNPIQLTESGSGDVEDDVADIGPPEKIGTRADYKDMLRMGKDQELRRNFRFLSILAFTCILMATWEAQLVASTFGLINGGLAGLIWVYIATYIGFGMVIASMAEMASMSPTSGGQYHWVSEFAPPSAQKFLSYLTGWICVLGWQTGGTSVAFLAAIQIQSLMVINNPGYNFENWHTTLLLIALCFLAIIFNTFLANKLPLVEKVMLVFHLCGFVIILVTLWVLAPHKTSTEVFTEFSNGGGWSSIGLSCLIGMLSPIYSFIGPDSAVHMAEEIKDSSYVLPRAMIWTFILNGALGFVMLVTFCFCLGDVDTILANPNVMPFVQIFLIATNSAGATSALATILIVLTVCGIITNIATASRQMFAFARDNGLPFSKHLAHVRPGWDIPLNSVLVSFYISVLLSLINIGSTTAFNAIASLATAALLSSYLISITCLRIKRWRNEPLPSSRWSLGKWGSTINDISILFLASALIFTFFPQATPVTPVTMNWSILIYGFTLSFATIFYFFRGRYTYIGPVTLIRKDN